MNLALRNLPLTCIIVLACLLIAPIAYAQTTKTYHFVNGQWFDGKRFRQQEFYVVEGKFTKKKPANIDEVVDLKNGFVVPPFADAHTHLFDGAYGLEDNIKKFLSDGVFYAKVQTNSRAGALSIKNKMNLPTSIDVAYAHGGLTSSFGHGVEVYEGLALFYRTGGFSPAEVQKVRASKSRENDAYYVLDTAEDVENKWPRIVAGKPDFIKLYLLSSEEHEQRIKRTDTVGDRGLDPKIIPLIVSKAKAAGLRVSAHVDTVFDYRVALQAGVNEMAHLPGYYIEMNDDTRKYELTADDAKETARRGIWVIPAPVAYDWFDPSNKDFKADVAARTDKVRAQNLRLLKQYKVKLAFGSDRYSNTPMADVLYLQKLGVFTNAELLKIWCEDTPQTIFPNRRIGKLQEGYEASFLVLNSNPLEKFDNVKAIRLRYKQGVPVMQ